MTTNPKRTTVNLDGDIYKRFKKADTINFTILINRSMELYLTNETFKALIHGCSVNSDIETMGLKMLHGGVPVPYYGNDPDLYKSAADIRKQSKKK